MHGLALVASTVCRLVTLLRAKLLLDGGDVHGYVLRLVYFLPGLRGHWWRDFGRLRLLTPTRERWLEVHLVARYFHHVDVVDYFLDRPRRLLLLHLPHGQLLQLQVLLYDGLRRGHSPYDGHYVEGSLVVLGVLHVVGAVEATIVRHLHRFFGA